MTPNVEIKKEEKADRFHYNKTKTSSEIKKKKKDYQNIYGQLAYKQ